MRRSQSTRASGRTAGCEPWRGLALVLSVLAFSGCGPSDSPPSALRRPNVVLITVDTLRADHVSSYGYPRETTPHIDALARRGVRFSKHSVQQSSTWPSLTSIMTSKYPHQHGVVRNGGALAAGQRTLAELLRDEGFATAAFLTNMTTTPHPGFEAISVFREGDRDEAATRASIEWLRSAVAQPFFLWVHLLGPHDPYDPGPIFFERFRTPYEGDLSGSRETLGRIRAEKRVLNASELAYLISLYDGDVAEVDSRVGRILDALRALDLESRTLVVFGSDHGELLYDRHYFFLHSEAIHSGVLDVPLIVALPGVVPEGREIAQVVESIDIAPTLLDLLGLEAPGWMRGRSLLPLVEGAPRGPGSESLDEPAAFAVMGAFIRSVRTARWLYIENDMPGRKLMFPIAARELYDLEADPRNQTNVVARHPEVAARLQRRLRSWWEESLDHVGSQAPVQATPEIEAELRALGYLEPSGAPSTPSAPGSE